MSFDDSVLVLEALNVLCNASDTSLRPHRTKLRATMHKLQSLVEDHGTIVVTASCDALAPSTDDPSQAPSSSVSYRSPPSSEDPSPYYADQRTPSRPSPNPHRVFPISIEGFVAEVNRDLETIEKSLSQVSQESVRDKPTWMTDDPRVVDLQIAGDHRHLSSIAKFRRGLSQRSLAIEFDEWEQTTYRTSRIKERTMNLLVKPSRKLGHIAEFLKINKYRFQNRIAARTGIEHGIKLLVCETLLSGIGFSAILIFQYSRLRSIKFEELDGLKDALKDANKIKKLADQKADWLDHCQREYNTWYNSTPDRSHAPLTAATKRRHSKVNALASLVRIQAKIPVNISDIAPISPLPPASRFPSLQHLIPSNPPPCFDYNDSSIGYNSINSNGDTYPSQRTNHWTETFNPQSETSMALVSSCPTQQGNPSLSTLHREHMGTTFFDPSNFVQEENPSYGPLHKQTADMPFNPSSYVHENQFVDTLRQEQITNTTFNPSSYVHETRFADTLGQEQVEATSSGFSNFTQQANSFFEHREQMRDMSFFDPADYLQ